MKFSLKIYKWQWYLERCVLYHVKTWYRTNNVVTLYWKQKPCINIIMAFHMHYSHIIATSMKLTVQSKYSTRIKRGNYLITLIYDQSQYNNHCINYKSLCSIHLRSKWIVWNSNIRLLSNTKHLIDI